MVVDGRRCANVLLYYALDKMRLLRHFLGEIYSEIIQAVGGNTTMNWAIVKK